MTARQRMRDLRRALRALRRAGRVTPSDSALRLAGRLAYALEDAGLGVYIVVRDDAVRVEADTPTGTLVVHGPGLTAAVVAQQMVRP